MPCNAPAPPAGMPPDLAESFGGVLARRDRLPRDLMWPEQEPERIAVFNLPWGRQNRPRAASSGKGRSKKTWVHDDKETERQKKRVIKAVREMGVELGDGPVAAYLSIFPENRIGDVDNVGKLQFDAATKGNLWRNDNMKILQDVGLRFAGVSKGHPFVRIVAVKWSGESRIDMPREPGDEEAAAIANWIADARAKGWS